MRFKTKQISAEPDAIAPDGAEVRVLCGGSRGGLAVFALQPKAVANAIAHRTVEEVWYVISGCGRMWRKLGKHEETVELGPGVSLSIPTGTHFQFRCDGLEALTVLGATMPPWPGEGEAILVKGKWPPHYMKTGPPAAFQFGRGTTYASDDYAAPAPQSPDLIPAGGRPRVEIFSELG